MRNELEPSIIVALSGGPRSLADLTIDTGAAGRELVDTLDKLRGDGWIFQVAGEYALTSRGRDLIARSRRAARHDRRRDVPALTD